MSMTLILIESNLQAFYTNDSKDQLNEDKELIEDLRILPCL